MGLKIITGNIWDEWNTGSYDVIAQGCNCLNTQKGGIAVDFVRRFGTDKFGGEHWEHDNISKLGNIDFQTQIHVFGTSEFDFEEKNVTIVNCYTQFGMGQKGKYISTWYPASEGALKLCMEKLVIQFSKQKILLPLIGGGLGGIPKATVIGVMTEVFNDVDATLVLYNKE